MQTFINEVNHYFALIYTLEGLSLKGNLVLSGFCQLNAKFS